MEESAIKQKLQSALDQLVRDHGALLQADANERSITHWLAVLLVPEFDEWNVDCEYNRDGDLPKRIRQEQTATTSDLNASTVYPDIIVHRRRSAESLLVVEA